VRALPGFDRFGDAMRDFSGAAFAPEVVDAMTRALDASIATLPDPVSSTQVNQLAESILRTAREGERDPAVCSAWRFLSCRSDRATDRLKQPFAFPGSFQRNLRIDGEFVCGNSRKHP